MKPTGVIIYQGPSLLDGAPIVAIAVGLASKSTNRKTGAMVQTYIIRSDIEPTRAVAQGLDSSICGDCRHRGDGSGKKRTCYVNVGQGALGVYRAFKRGRYPVTREYAGMLFAKPMLNREACIARGRAVRLGTYGDPAAVPVHVWNHLLRHSNGHTGYTHQWRKTPSLKTLCMASVDSPEEALEAQRLGWRTFRVGMQSRNTVSKAMLKESLCPASAQAGKLLTCEKCLACSGADGRKASIYIPAHGGFAVMANVAKLAGIPITVA
jgi:hypothetical protein